MRLLRLLTRSWVAVWSSPANRSLVFLLLIIGALQWAGRWEWWCWLLVIFYLWWTLHDAVLREWAPEVIHRTARPSVWTFRFSFSKRYVEGFLAEHGACYRFDEASESRLGAFPDRMILESYPDRLRIHRWLVPAVGGAGPPKYDWFDTPRPGEVLLWSHPLSDAAAAKPPFAVRLSVLFAGDKKRNKVFRKLTLWLDRGIRRIPTAPFPTVPSVDILFEVPLDAEMLGDFPGDPSQERKRICRTDASASGYTWACYAGTADQFDWGWSLHLRPVEPR